MGSELCKTCIHTKVCMHDKNLVGDVFVMGHPMMFDNDKLYEQYKERERQGFPCEDYMPTAEPTDEVVALYCKRRCLKIITEELYLHLKQGLYNPQPSMINEPKKGKWIDITMSDYGVTAEACGVCGEWGCEGCKYNGRRWDEEPCDSCTISNNHYEARREEE